MRGGGRRWRRATGVTGAVLLCVGLGLGVAKAVQAAGSGAVDTPEEEAAQALLVGRLNTVAMNSAHRSIEDFARAAGHLGLTVVDVERQDATQGTDVLGHLSFSVLLDESSAPAAGGLLTAPEWDPGPYCFRVAFDGYGKHGEFGTADGVHLVACPDDATPVALPPQEVVRAAPNAAEAARQVLDALPASGLPSEDEIAAEVTALLAPPDATNPDLHVSTAAPSVVVDGDDVGIAMGGPDDCVLVKRSGGVVSDVYAPAVYLQPGELGCVGGTALVDDLRPPH